MQIFQVFANRTNKIFSVAKTGNTELCNFRNKALRICNQNNTKQNLSRTCSIKLYEPVNYVQLQRDFWLFMSKLSLVCHQSVPSQESFLTGKPIVLQLRGSCLRTHNRKMEREKRVEREVPHQEGFEPTTTKSRCGLCRCATNAANLQTSIICIQT